MISGSNLLTVAFAPLVPWAVIWGIAGVAAALLLFGAFHRARGTVLRFLAIGAGLAALANPAIIQEEREPVTDVVAVVADRSLSQAIGDRLARTDQALAQITDQLAAFENIEVRVIDAGAADVHAEQDGHPAALRGSSMTAVENRRAKPFADSRPGASSTVILRLPGRPAMTIGTMEIAPGTPLTALLTASGGQGTRMTKVGDSGIPWARWTRAT